MKRVSDKLQILLSTLISAFILTGLTACLSGTVTTPISTTPSSSGSNSSTPSSSGSNSSTPNTPLNTTPLGGTVLSPLTLTDTVSTFAGSVTGAVGYANGFGVTASFSNPRGVTTDGTNLYVADSVNNQIRKIVIATGEVTLLAGSPTGLSGSTNGTGTSALFYTPYDLTTDGTNLYVADTNNNLIRQVVISTGAVTTLAGGGPGSWSNGIGTIAGFNQPQGITNVGNYLYVAEQNNYDVRRIDITTAEVIAFAGGGSGGVTGNTSGTGTAALFGNLRGITTDGTNLYVVDVSHNEIKQIVIASAAVTTIAGSPTGASGITNGTGSGALFKSPWGITTDGTNLYVTEYLNNDVRQIVIATGVVTTIAGGTGTPGLANGTGNAALFNVPAGITSNGHSLFVADTNNNEIRQIQ